MSEIKQIDLQNLKSLIKMAETNYQKLNNYINQVEDQQIKQVLTKSAQDELNTKQKLMTFLN